MFKFKTKLLSIFLLISILFNPISVFADSSKDISVKNYKEKQFCDLIFPFSVRDRRNERKRLILKDLIKLRIELLEILKMPETEEKRKKIKQILEQIEQIDLEFDFESFNKIGLILESYMPLKIIMEEKTLKVTGYFYPDISLKPVKIISSHGGDITKKLLNDTLELDDCFQTIDVKFERQRELGLREKIDKDKKEKIDKDKDWRMSMVLFIEELSLSTNIPLTILFGKGSILEIPLNDKFRLKKVIANGTDVTTKIVNEHEFEFKSIGDNIFVLEISNTYK